MSNIEEQRKQEKNFAHVLTVIFLLICAWFVKQNAKINREKETGVKEPMDVFDKAGCLVVVSLLGLLALGIIIGIIGGLYEAIVGK